MKVIRGEDVSNHQLGRDLFGGYRAYCRIRKAQQITLRTALKVQRFYRLTVALPFEDFNGVSCVTK